MTSILPLLWRQHPVFSTAPEQVLLRLAERYPSKSYKAGATILSAGRQATHLYVLLRGTTKIFHRTSDGREAVMKLLQAPNSFGEIELFHGLPWLESVAAVEESIIARIPADDYIAFLQRHPDAMFAALQQMSAAFCIAARNEQQIFATLEQRIANLLLSYAELYGKPRLQPGITQLIIASALSQQDIAQSLGAVRRSVALILSKWNTHGWVYRTSGAWHINHVAALEKLAAPIRGSLPFRMGMSLRNLAETTDEETFFIGVVRGPGSLQGRTYQLDQELLVGRSAPCQILLPDDHVCPLHCRIFRSNTGNRIWLEDLKSVNGTWVGDRTILRVVLRPEQTFRVGGIELMLCQK